MAIVFNCECGKELRAKAEWAGKKTKCPSCGSTVHIPLPEPVAKEAPEPAPKAHAPAESEAIPVDFSIPESTAGSAEIAPSQMTAQPAPSGEHVEAPSSEEYAPPPPRAEGHPVYKVLTPKEYGIPGKFNPGMLEDSLNAHAREGWVVKTAAVINLFGHTGSHDELILILER